MMNQDQYHASLLNKGQPVGLGWDGITKATKPKVGTVFFYELIRLLHSMPAGILGGKNQLAVPLA